MRARLVRGVALVAAALIAAIGAVAGIAASAQATEIPNAITSVALTSGPGPYVPDATVTFSGTWAVPNGSQPGDTFTLTLPSQLSWAGATTFPLMDANGNVVANAVVSSTGVVTFTLDPYVATHPDDIAGTFTFSTLFTAAQTQPGTQTLTFDVGATVIKVPITVTGPNAGCTSNCDGSAPSQFPAPFKVMNFTDATQTSTRSYIAGPVGSLTNNTVVVTDTPGPGLAIDCTSIDPVVGEHIDQWGDLVAPLDSSLYPPTIDCTTSQLTVTWTGIPAHENVGVYLKTTITDQNQPSYSNTGTFTVNGTTSPVQARAVRSTESGTGSGVTPPPTASAPPVTATPVPASPQPTGSATPQTASIASSRRLADTGSDLTVTFSVAVALLAAGIALSILRRPQRQSDQ